MTVNKVDLVGGLSLFALGAAILAIALTYNIGSATRMGPGYFPMVLGGLMMVLAALIALAALRPQPAAPEPDAEPVTVSWRPMIAVLLSIVGFMVGMAYGGLLPAVFLTVIISSLGDAKSRWLGIAVLCVALPFATWLIFSRGLGMPIPLIKVPF